MKEKACKALGIHTDVRNISEQITEEELINHIQNANTDPLIDGILVQLPLPKHINTDRLLQNIDAKKDVDGFHPCNMGKLVLKQDTLISCTPLGILKLLENAKIPLLGSHAVIVGASNIVGKPMAILLQNQGATVTICNSKTKNLSQHTSRADILIVATGKINTITKDMVKKGAVVVDVGITRLDDGKLTGDVDFENVKNQASHITPVPGGVGPMTIAMLLQNTVQATQKNRYK